MEQPTLHCPCAGRHCRTAFSYSAPPAGETAFDLGGAPYARAYARCELCGHWFAENPMDLGGLYAGAYVDNTYGERLRATYERILALPPERSDNSARVAGLVEFAQARFGAAARPRLLDVGSGLAVFVARLKAAGWRCTALDPDPRAAAHARDSVGVAAIAGDFMTTELPPPGSFDVVCFNKVLEHLPDPVAMLARARPLLAAGGFVYFEVPDGEAAAGEGPGREEFFIEHHHVFSPASAALLTARAGFALLRLQRLREASGKFTLRVYADCS